MQPSITRFRPVYSSCRSCYLCLYTIAHLLLEEFTISLSRPITTQSVCHTVSPTVGVRVPQKASASLPVTVPWMFTCCQISCVCVCVLRSSEVVLRGELDLVQSTVEVERAQFQSSDRLRHRCRYRQTDLVVHHLTAHARGASVVVT